jgi:hypothetical protein
VLLANPWMTAPRIAKESQVVTMATPPDGREHSPFFLYKKQARAVATGFRIPLDS